MLNGSHDVSPSRCFRHDVAVYNYSSSLLDCACTSSLCQVITTGETLAGGDSHETLNAGDSRETLAAKVWQTARAAPFRHDVRPASVKFNLFESPVKYFYVCGDYFAVIQAEADGEYGIAKRAGVSVSPSSASRSGVQVIPHRTPVKRAGKK